MAAALTTCRTWQRPAPGCHRIGQLVLTAVLQDATGSLPARPFATLAPIVDFHYQNACHLLGIAIRRRDRLVYLSVLSTAQEAPAVALPRNIKTRLLLLVISSLVLLLAVTLAPQRAFLRISSLTRQLRFTPPARLLFSPRPYTTIGKMAPQKHRDPPQAPPLFNATAESIAADAKRLVDKLKATVDKIVAEVPPEKATFATVLEPYLLQDSVNDDEGYRLTFYQCVSATADIREASVKAEQMMSDFYIDCKTREDYFQLIDAAYNTRQSQNLSAEQLHILEKEHRSYVENGLLLPAGPERDRFKEIRKRINQLCIDAQKNMNEENGGIYFTPEQLKGIPEDDVDIKQLEKGTGENEGKVRLSFKYTHSVPLGKYAQNEETRRDYSIADNNKLNINVPIIHEIFVLRDQAARMLGYNNHASLRIAPKMAKTPERVTEFLSTLRTRLTEGAKAEAEKLLEYKKKDCAERSVACDDNLYSWDLGFYTRMMKEKEFSVDDVAISQYFPTNATFSAMLRIFEDLLGLRFVELDAEDMARISPSGKAGDVLWHEEVRVFTVWDEEALGGEFCGYLFIDLHPRPFKYSHNANFGLQPGYLRTDGTRHYPCTSLVCNFSKASSDKPALLKHHEAVTMFHELGHGIHDLVGRTRYGCTSGTRVVADFLEAPSQMLENWCWEPSVLKSLSGHWKTGEPMPDDFIEKLIPTKHVSEATATVAQILIGTYDMSCHQPESNEVAKGRNYGKLWNELRLEISGVKGPESVGYGFEWGNRHCSVGHFVGGYDAGYYGYLYSQVFSTDMYHSKFSGNPMNPEEGRRYRKLVLGRGGSIEEMELLKDFLGREPNTEAFYKELGLSD